MKKYLIAVLALLLLTGCGKNEVATEPAEVETTTVAETTLPYIPSVLDEAKKDGTAVETPYITLYYPNTWTELKTAEVTQDGENCRVTFKTAVANRELELFSLIFGPEEAEGYFLGTLDGVLVYSLMNEQNPADWSEEDYMEISRQQEYINELFLQIYEMPGFVQA